jgi:NMD protein affecting ribosome stability and mRNA decay
MSMQTFEHHELAFQIRNLRELEHDPYHGREKLAEPRACPECGASYHQGRWVWQKAAPHAHLKLCPACQRIKDRCPAGFLTIVGDFYRMHKQEIINLIVNVEIKEKADHPLKRIIEIQKNREGQTFMTFTDPQLARAVGEALYHAYKGELKFDYQAGEFLLRVWWIR